jgi:amidase
LRKAGAIIIGRTNVPAFCARYFTDNALHGRTLNLEGSVRSRGTAWPGSQA